jgi:hypothetical protein
VSSVSGCDEVQCHAGASFDADPVRSFTVVGGIPEPLDELDLLALEEQ